MAFLTTLAMVFLPALAAEGEGGAPAPADTRAVMSRWLSTQRLISKEKEDWQQAKQILQSRIDLVGSEIAALEEKLAQVRTTAAEANRGHADVARDRRSLESAATALARSAADLEDRLRALFPLLPEPLRLKLRPLVERMPAAATAAETKQSLAERFQNVVGILNEVNQFNGQITLATEVRTLSDGKPAEVKTIYVGLGQAYFVSAGGEAGSGRPADGSWQWELDRELAPDVIEAVEILQSKAKPRLIALPVKLR
jgi:ABC-type transporter Mla subunit MlaD